MQTIEREDDLIINNPYYKEIMDREYHHDHEIVLIDNILRWRVDPLIDSIIDRNSLNDIVVLLRALGLDKNSEEYRKMYRGMGYSLFGYWEIFYWEANNEDSDKYRTGG